MTQHTTDQTILSNISHLVDEERKLYAKGEFSDAERDRLKKIGVELDQCWDLLRQRRLILDDARLHRSRHMGRVASEAHHAQQPAAEAF